MVVQSLSPMNRRCTVLVTTGMTPRSCGSRAACRGDQDQLAPAEFLRGVQTRKPAPLLAPSASERTLRVLIRACKRYRPSSNQSVEFQDATLVASVTFRCKAASADLSAATPPTSAPAIQFVMETF